MTDAQGLFDIDSTTVTIGNVAPDLSGQFGIPRSECQHQRRLPGNAVRTIHRPLERFADSHDRLGRRFAATAVVAVEHGAGIHRATAPHPVPQASTNYAISVTVTDQDSGRDSEAISLVVAAPSAVLRGQKFEDVDGDAVRDADEPALAGWTIELVDAASGEVLQTTVTDGEGAYEFSEVPRGDLSGAKSNSSVGNRHRRLIRSAGSALMHRAGSPTAIATLRRFPMTADSLRFRRSLPISFPRTPTGFATSLSNTR